MPTASRGWSGSPATASEGAAGAAAPTRDKTLLGGDPRAGMNARRITAEYPLQVFFAVAALAAVVATTVVAVGGGSLSGTLRLAALATVLALFALGFAAGPLAERYL